MTKTGAKTEMEDVCKEPVNQGQFGSCTAHALLKVIEDQLQQGYGVSINYNENIQPVIQLGETRNGGNTKKVAERLTKKGLSVENTQKNKLFKLKIDATICSDMEKLKAMIRQAPGYCNFVVSVKTRNGKGRHAIAAFTIDEVSGSVDCKNSWGGIKAVYKCTTENFSSFYMIETAIVKAENGRGKEIKVPTRQEGFNLTLAAFKNILKGPLPNQTTRAPPMSPKLKKKIRKRLPKKLPELDGVNWDQIMQNCPKVVAGKLTNLNLKGEFDLDNKKLGDEKMRIIAPALAINIDVHTVMLKNNQLSKDGIKYFAAAMANFTDLKQLSLEKNKIGDVGAGYLALGFFKMHQNGRGRLEAIKKLDLSYNNITSHGFKALIPWLKRMEGLTHLDLQGNEICEEGATEFQGAFSSMKSLIVLNMRSNGSPLVGSKRKVFDSPVKKAFKKAFGSESKGFRTCLF
eukprot:g14668.t1